MSLADRISFLVVERPKTLIASVLVLAGLCIWIVAAHQRFDSDVLNLLPAKAPEVQALREAQGGFRQGKEIVFALRGAPEVVADFEEEFIEGLRGEPWVERVFATSPMESPEELARLARIVPGLLLNLPDDQFRELVSSLQPSAMGERVRRLRADLESGSPRAEMQATIDPTGLLGRALRPMTGSTAMERGQALSSEDGSLRLVPVVTKQPSLSQADCSATMAQVEAFRQRVLTSGTGPKPEILVTGRTPYVAQIATAMQRDVSVTSAISFCVVTLLFFIGFRRLVPPLGTTLILGLSCFVAFAVGCLFFENLNMVAISFCSILAGLGDDFSLLLYNRYLVARSEREEHRQAIATSIRDVGRGILYVAFTTGAGFLALLFSGSSGFAQLGTLIAVGIVLCGILVILLLFLFIRPGHAHPERPDPLHSPFERLVSLLLNRSRALSLLAGGATIVAVGIAAWSRLPLSFDTNPRSLEPKTIPAALALHSIGEKIPASREPVILLVKASTPEELHRRWDKLELHLQSLVQRGFLQSFSSPAALLLSPDRAREHGQQLLGETNLEASRAAFTDALQQAGFRPESFSQALELFSSLGTAAASASPTLALEGTLPKESAWWFLLDRYFGTHPLLTAAYLRLVRPLATPEEKDALDRAIHEAGVPVQITGWSYTMVGLIPWAKKELAWFSFAVGTLIFVAMALVYRRWQPLLVHTLSLVFGLSACVSLLKLTGTQINMLNALAFPLVLGVGVDYGMHVLLAMLEGHNQQAGLTTVVKPLVISGLTTIAGFGALMFAQNPALKGLGTVCALGVSCCLVSSLFFAVPVLRVLLRNESRV